MLLRRAVTKTPDKHLAAWYFPPYLNTECFCRRRTYWCGKYRNCSGRLLRLVAQLGAEDVGDMSEDDPGNFLWQSREPWGNGQKEKEKPDDRDGGCQLQRMSGRTSISVEVVKKSKILPCGPFKLNSNKSLVPWHIISFIVFSWVSHGQHWHWVQMCARSVLQSWEQMSVTGGLFLWSDPSSLSHIKTGGLSVPVGCP